jgi:RNA ligase (TIGR02306 family)
MSESDSQKPISLVYIGKVIEVTPIEGADFIASATVVCGQGGKWRGVIKKSDFEFSSLCAVFLPDSLLPESEKFAFLKSSGWRVKMRKFKGAPSEVLIMPCPQGYGLAHIGEDITELYGVTKYCKPMPAHLNGIAIGYFPDFIPKTDELNYQRHPSLVEDLVGKPYYITEKADGSSTTAFRYKGKFGLCSRNLELERNEDNGYWKVAIKYKLEENLPEGIALQWETCGPGIQSNPMGLSEMDGFAFSAYDIQNQCYLEAREFYDLCKKLKFPTCRLFTWDDEFSKKGLETLGEGKYLNGKEREGVVVRSQQNFGSAPISFKVINLNYEK